jgi:hypothetical protein
MIDAGLASPLVVASVRAIPRGVKPRANERITVRSHNRISREAN